MTDRTEPVATADLYDAAPGEVNVCDLPFRLFGPRKRFAGPCFTLRAKDHGAVGTILREPGQGRVLVVDTLPGPVPVAMLGDRLATIAVENGWEAILVNGAVRDSEALSRLPIAIAATGTTPRRAEQPSNMFERDQLVEMGSAVFSPGHWVVGDEDGIIICAKAVLSRI